MTEGLSTFDHETLDRLAETLQVADPGSIGEVVSMARAFLRRVSSEVKNRALGEMLCAPVIGKVKAWGDSSPIVSILEIGP